MSNPTASPEVYDSNATFAPGTPPSAPPRAASKSGFGTTALPEVDRAAKRPRLRDRNQPRFEVTGTIGSGGLGDVVAAFDNDIGRKVAIKRIRTDRLSDGVIIRFLQEIRTVGRLEHANIIPIHDVGRDAEGALYFVMRYVDGETLESIISKLRAGDKGYHRQYGLEKRVQIMAAVFEALAFAHANGVIHRDVKPANVMVGKWGEVLLLDWGIARLAEVADEVDADVEGKPGETGALAQTRVGAVLGTPAYMSPEQARGEPADARSDIYSVTVMMHEFLTLEHYLHDVSGADAMLKELQVRKHKMAMMMSPPHQVPVPADLAWYMVPGLNKDPADRYPSVEAMLDRLARRAEGDIPVQCHSTFTKRFTYKFMKFWDRHGLALLIIFAITGLSSLAVALASSVAVLSLVVAALH